MRSLHQRGRKTKKFHFLSSSCLCLRGWGSSSLEILQVCSCAEPGSLQLGIHVAKRCRIGFLEVDRVPAFTFIIRASDALNPSATYHPQNLLVDAFTILVSMETFRSHLSTEKQNYQIFVFITWTLPPLRGSETTVIYGTLS